MTVSTDRVPAWRSGTRAALDYSFDLTVYDEDLVLDACDYLSPFPEIGGSGQASYAIGRNAEGQVEVRVDGELIGKHVADWRGVSLLGWHLNQSVVDTNKDAYVLMHAAVAARDDVGVLLPAPMEHGKTTTVTGLVRAGFSYLTDEAAALDPETLEIHAYPKPLTIDEGSWPLFPELRPGRVADSALSWWVPVTRIRPDAVRPTVRPGLVVFPQFRRGAATVVRELGQTEATLRLAECTFAFVDHATRNLAVAARLARTRPAFELTIGDLDAAVDAVSRLVDAERTS